MKARVSKSKWFVAVINPLCFGCLLFIAACSGQSKVLPKDNLTVDTEDSLFYIEGQLCQHLRVIYEDKKGNLWFGTNVYGLMRYDGDTLQYFDEGDGVGSGRITEILEDPDDNLWIATSGGLTKYDPVAAQLSGKDTFTNYTSDDPSISHNIWSMIIDDEGIFWLGTLDGVSQFDGKSFTSFPIPKAIVEDTSSIMSYDRVSAIMKDRSDVIWMGTDGFGICKYDPSIGLVDSLAFTQITTADGLCDNNVSDLMEDKQGNIWIATMYGGISKYDGSRFYNYTMDGDVQGIETGALYEDKHGAIWFAAENEGIYKYDNKKFSKYTKDNGLNTNGVLSIYQDSKNNYWLGGWGGLFRSSPSGQNMDSIESVTKAASW